MKLEQQVCALELAIRLKELGVKQNAYWKWISNDEGATWILWPFEVLHDNEYSAFSVAELGALLPDCIYYKNTFIFLVMTKDEGIYKLSYDEICSGEHLESFFKCEDINEANVRTKLLIMLIENKLIEVENAE